MKFFIYVWSYVTLYPILMPIVLLPLLWLARATILSYSHQVNAVVTMFIATGIIAGATYFDYVRGPESYADFLAKRGVETDATVTAARPANASTAAGNGSANVVEILFRDENSRTYKLPYSSDQCRLVPSVNGIEPLPEIGEQVRIRYYPQVETGFIILMDPSKSAYGARTQCVVLKARATAAESAYKAQDVPSESAKTAYRKALESLLGGECLNPADHHLYQDVLKTI